MKHKKLLVRLFAVIFSVAFCVSLAVVPANAFFLSSVSKIDGANIKIYPDRHMDNIYGEDFDFVYITQLQDSAETSNGVSVEDAREMISGKTPAWSSYARFKNLDDYLTSAYRQIASIEFIVVYTGEPDGSALTRFKIVADGNYFLPQDKAVYYEDGLRVLYSGDTGLYSFSFLQNYWYFNSPAYEGYSLATIVYHKDTGASHADSDKYVTRAEYNRVAQDLQECKKELTQAQVDYEIARQKYEESIANLQAECNDLDTAYAEKVKQIENLKNNIASLERTQDSLQTKINTLRGDLENNNAVKNLFQGAYESVHGFCQDIFGLSFGGVSVGSVLSIVFVMAIVFFLVKILRG